MYLEKARLRRRLLSSRERVEAPRGSRILSGRSLLSSPVHAIYAIHAVDTIRLRHYHSRAPQVLELLGLLVVEIVGQAPAAAPGGVDDAAIALLHVDLAARADVDPAGGGAALLLLDPVVGARGARPPAHHAVGLVHAALGDEAVRQRVPAFPVPDDAAAAAEPAAPAAAPPDRELPHQHGIPLLDDLDVRRARVGHVDLDGRGAVPGRARALAAADRLAVAEPEAALGGSSRLRRAVAEEPEAVHAALGPRRGPERVEQEVDEPLRRQRVAAADGGPRRRVQEAVLGQDDPRRREAPLVQRDVRPDQEPERVDQRRVGDGGRRVHVRQHLARRPREVERPEPVLVYGDGHLHHGPVVQELLGLERLRSVFLVGRLEVAADGYFRVLLDLRHVEMDRGFAVFLHQSVDEITALGVGSYLGLEIRPVAAG